MSSGVSSTPTGDLGSRCVAKPPSVDLASVKYIVSKASIAEAWKKVQANKGAPGVDKISIAKFPKWGRPKWKTFKKQLLEGAYQPSPALRDEIPKESGGCAVQKLDEGGEVFCFECGVSRYHITHHV